ncbi:DUF4274 domain-containing protein [Chryseobacterium pennae]|uniref:DUF4274 domain-containing protein n=1 Tax=Chryseobacterium pennae TaxID=2258962 RepID=A0A3D9C414_9FLAO|nr:DUF4274 domain-containing protein [Chryseobacterium pennae]REC60605.1 DUF4274 domain-containing protein [Chryseobacterium pennae]
MINLTSEQQNFINDNFYEGILQNELKESKFKQLTTSEELHYLATQHNWDDGVKVLQWIAESPVCSEATALELFWLAQPQDFQQYALDHTLKNESQNEVFTLLKILLKNYPNHFYQKTAIEFDPTSFCDSEFMIPDWIFQKTNGEESYIYYEESDVEVWFDREWENNIRWAKSTIELFNIAYFIEEPEYAALVLQNRFCDKGTAVLVFWRLYTECSLYTYTNTMLQGIINKIENNHYPEILSYNPQTDEKVDYKKKKIAWELPEIFRKPV